jgi:AcrR family transcriptional regulator
MTVRMMRREGGSLSLRDLSAAAGVAIPTLRHYFGARHQVVDAIFEECLRLGRAGLDQQRRSEKAFAESIQDYVRALVTALYNGREARLGDIIAVSLAEGLLDPKLSPSTLNHIIDPTVDALEARLTEHIARGEMLDVDTRAAALMLLSPILVACLHQDQLSGATTNPLAMEKLVADISAAFVRAFARPTPERSRMSA